MYSASIFEFLGILSTEFIIHGQKRRKGSFIIMMIISALCFSFLFINVPIHCNKCIQSHIQTALIGFTKFFTCVAEVVLLIYYTEQYPSQIRSIGNIFILSMGMIGTIMIPRLIELSKEFGFHPMVYFGICATITAILCLGLNETHGKPI